MNQKIISYFLLISIIGLICFCILYKANWLFAGSLAGDDYQLLMTTAINKASHGATWSARFWPLGLSDYSVLLLIPYGSTPTAHYIYNCIILSFSSSILFTILNKTTNQKYFISLFALLILFSSSSFMQVHMECIYPERMILFLLCVFIWSYKKAKITQKFVFYLIAMLSIIYSTYMKETVFIIFSIISLIELFFSKLSKKEKLFNLLSLINSIIFVGIYIFRRLSKSHNEVYASLGISKSSFALFLNEPILYLLVFLTLFRLYAFFINKDRSQILEDSLLFSACSFSSAYFILQLTLGYYLLPSIAIFLPAFVLFFEKSSLIIKNFIIFIFIFIACHNFEHTKYIVTNDWKHRAEDYLFFEYLIDEFYKGKKIYWLSNLSREKTDYSYCHFDSVMCLNRIQHFMNFYSKYQIQIEKIYDLNNITDNDIILCNSITIDKSLSKELKHKSFLPQRKLLENIIFSKSDK